MTLSTVTPAVSATAHIPDASTWRAESGNAWCAAQPRILGANFIPANAIEQLEMWQA
jgi:hypothetical protein